MSQPPTVAPGESRFAIAQGLAELAHRYDGFILDVWGVLHNGIAPYPGVVETLYRLKSEGKKLCVLSNAPARAEVVAQRVAQIGVPRDAYDHIMTSGEDVWQHLFHRPDDFYQGLGQNCLHIGPERDDHVMVGLPFHRVRNPAEADFILNTGPSGPEDRIDPYLPMLDEALARGLPMICANPDLTVMRGSTTLICAGALAQYYEQKGGLVRWHGKPFGGVYATCFKLLGLADKSRIVGVGDSPRTDVAGAYGAGIDSVLVAGGLHANELGYVPGEPLDPVRVREALEGKRHPTHVIGRLNW